MRDIGFQTFGECQLERHQLIRDDGRDRAKPLWDRGYFAKTDLKMYRYGQVGYLAEFVAKLIGYGLFRLEDITKTVAQLSIGQRKSHEYEAGQ